MSEFDGLTRAIDRFGHVVSEMVEPLADFSSVLEEVVARAYVLTDVDYDWDLHNLDNEYWSHPVMPAVTDGDAEWLNQVAALGYVRGVKVS